MHSPNFALGCLICTSDLLGPNPKSVSSLQNLLPLTFFLIPINDNSILLTQYKILESWLRVILLSHLTSYSFANTGFCRWWWCSFTERIPWIKPFILLAKRYLLNSCRSKFEIASPLIICYFWHFCSIQYLKKNVILSIHSQKHMDLEIWKWS